MLKKHYMFIFILFLSIFLRMYRIDTLATFGRDQGIDFLVVRDILVDHKLTLIGIKVSIADFFQGPIYLYMLVPLFWLFHLNPLAGAYTAVLVSSLGIIILYITLLKFTDLKFANLTALYYATCPQLVIFGNTPLYQNFLPLFILLTIYLLLSLNTNNHKGFIFAFLIGVMASVSTELHLLAITLVTASFIYLIIHFFKRKFSYIAAYLIGLLTGFSPTIIFEIRHNFLNTYLLSNYLNSNPQTLLMSNFSILKTKIFEFVFLNDNFLIIIPALFGVYILFQKNKVQKKYSNLKQFTLILFIVTLIFCFRSTSLGTHYFLPLFFAFILLIPAYISYAKHQKILLISMLLLIITNTIITVSQLNDNHGYFMPAGWSLKKIEQVADIINLDAEKHQNFNVASLLDGDTRTYPLRYSIEIRNKFPGPVTDYSSNDYLYVVARTQEEIIKSTVWEIYSTKPFQIKEKWKLQDGIVLYRLDRN